MLELQTLDGSALVAKTEYPVKEKNDLPKHLGRDNQWKKNKDNLWCTYCKTPMHTREKCWKLKGKPPSREWGNRGGQQRAQVHMAKQSKTEENSTIGGFNNEEIDKLVGIHLQTCWSLFLGSFRYRYTFILFLDKCLI